MVTFTIGELFSSFSELQEKILIYSEENFCHFYVKDSKKLTPEEIVNPDLIYKHISFSCIYGGQKPRFRGSGTRSVTSIRHGCGSGLYLRVTKDRYHLQVRNFINTHNHEITEELYRSASQDRKLPWELKLEVEELLLLGADKDRLIEYIRNTVNKNIDKKHLFNLYETAVKHQREITRERAVMLLQKVYCVDTEKEADSILTHLLENTRPPRRSRKVQVHEENDDNVQYTFINEGDETVDVDMSEELQRIMGSLQGSEAERIVIVEGDEQYEVIEADHGMEAEYLEEDERETDEVELKQEPETVREGRLRQFVKRPIIAKARPVNKYSSQDYEPPSKVRAVSNQSVEDPLATRGELRRDVEKEKLDVLNLKKSKLLRDIAKIDLEKTKLNLDIDICKKMQSYIIEKQHATELKKEKLQLEIEKLKAESK